MVSDRGPSASMGKAMGGVNHIFLDFLAPKVGQVETSGEKALLGGKIDFSRPSLKSLTWDIEHEVES